MSAKSNDAVSWVRLARHPLRYAHASWRPSLPLAIEELESHARTELEARLTALWGLETLDRKCEGRPGARVGVVAPEVHATLFKSLLMVSTGDEGLADGDASAARLARLLSSKDLPWRPIRAASAGPEMRRRLLEEQLAARLCAAALPMGRAWSGRWRIRHPRDLQLEEVNTTADTGWWTHVEESLVQLYGGRQGVPCL